MTTTPTSPRSRSSWKPLILKWRDKHGASQDHEQRKGHRAATYKKEQLVASKRYANRRDLIRALLEDGKAYTLNEVDGLIEKYMKGKVN